MLITETAAASFHFNVITIFYLCSAVPSNTFSSFSNSISNNNSNSTAIVTTTSPSSPSSHLILGLSLSLIILVLLLPWPLCLLYARRYLCPRLPPPTSSHDSTAFGPTSAPLPLPTQLTRPPSSPPNLPERRLHCHHEKVTLNTRTFIYTLLLLIEFSTISLTSCHIF